MTTKLIIQQDATLNSHVLDLSPVSWPTRWAWMKEGLWLAPIWFCGCAFWQAMRWIDDLPASWGQFLAGFLTLTLLGCLGVAALHEWLDWHEKKSSRRLSLGPKQIIMHPRRTLPWKAIQGWHWAPLAGNADLQKLTVIYLPYAKARFTRQWSMVVTDPAQVEALREWLSDRIQAGQPGASLLTTLPVSHPIPLAHMFMGMAFMTLGMLSLMFSKMMAFLGMLFLLFNFQIQPDLFSAPKENRNLIGLFEDFAALFRSNSTYELGWALVITAGVMLLTTLALFKLGNLQLNSKTVA
ncbi:MAG TPA: hypothetical protein VGH19_14080 [Verrucomicrobiae bacterium]